MTDMWHPCRLVNQCFIPDLDGCKQQSILVTYEANNGRRYVEKTGIYNGRIMRKENRVVAWMYLPDPYEGGTNNA